MRRREPVRAQDVIDRGPLSDTEQRRVRELLRHPPSPADLEELDEIAGGERVVPGYLLAGKHYDAETVTAEALRNMLLYRYATPTDYWRAL